ncbi:hypothetical protein Emed_006313 [Eimeria media]
MFLTQGIELRATTQQQGLERSAQHQEITLNAGAKIVRKRTHDFGTADIRQNRWWHSTRTLTSATGPEMAPEEVNLAISQHSRLWLAKVWIGDRCYEALVDSGATRSFILPSVAVTAHLETVPLEEAIEFQVASGAPFQVRNVVRDLTYYWKSNKHAAATGDFLVAYIPFPLILGTDCLHSSEAIWDVARGILRLCTY